MPSVSSFPQKSSPIGKSFYQEEELAVCVCVCVRVCEFIQAGFFPSSSMSTFKCHVRVVGRQTTDRVTITFSFYYTFR